MGNILGLETVKDLNIVKLQNVNKTLDECESCENVKLQNVIEIIFDGYQSYENRTRKQVDKNIVSQGYKESDQKHKNKVSIKLPNMENVNSEFRQKLKNLLIEFKDIFEGNGKLIDFKYKLYVDESVQPTAQRLRRLLYHMRRAIKEEIKRLERLDIIKKGEGLQD